MVVRKYIRRMPGSFFAVLCVLAMTACGDDLETAIPVMEIPTVQVSKEGVPENTASADASDISGETESGTGEGNSGAPSGIGEGGDSGASADIGEGGNSGASSGIGEGGDSGESSGMGAADSLEASAGAGGQGSTESSEIHITISAAGDVIMGNYIGQGYENSFNYTYAQGVGDSYFFENVLGIFEADDLTIVNLEAPLTLSDDYREGQIYTLSGDPKYVNILTAGSVEAVSMGNNHRLDYKQQGTDDTVKVLEEAGILYAYDNIYCMYEVKGIKIGMVSVNIVGQGYAVETYLQEGIAELREDGADLVFACCHWGIEKEYYPESYQKSLGKKCIDWGYDLVIGCHPHVLQGIEEYEGKFIIYSLGNFCFGANRNPTDKDSMIFQQTFTFIDGEKQEDKEIRVIPCSVSSVSSRNDYKPTPAEGDEAQRIIDKINECSKDMGVQFDSEGYLIKNQDSATP